MAGGAILDAFLDFISGTGTLRLTPSDHVIQLVTRHTFLWSRLWKNNGMEVQGGQDMTFWFLPKGGGTFEEVLPGSPTSPINPQVLQKGIIDWRFTRAHSTIVDAEVLLNDRIRYGTDEARFEQFVKIRDEKATIRRTDVAIGLENQLSAVPNKSKMEGALTLGATSPYSIFAHINQDTTGLWGSGWTVTTALTAAGGAWTVKEGITPGSAAVNGNMSPQVQKYSLSAPDVPTNIIGGMDGLRMELKWEQPDSLSQYKADEKLNNLMYLTSKQGRMAFMSLMRGDNDRYLMGNQDPAYPDPQFQGVPITRWDPLETAAVYDSASAGDALRTEGLAGGSHKKGPRVYALNGNFLHPIAHDQRLFFVDKAQREMTVPDTNVQYESTWWNLPCKSYKHQGILVPSADVYIDASTGGNLYA